MRMQDSISKCLRTSLKFQGRASRQEFWLFFPFGIALPFLIGVVCFAAGVSLAVSFVSVIAAALPLLAVGSRRLQDTGEPGELAVTPWARFSVAVLAAYWAIRLSADISRAFDSQTPPDGPGGLGFVVIYGGGSLALAVAALAALLLFLNSITPAFAQTMLPSQPGPNKYGPNPHEVPS